MAVKAFSGGPNDYHTFLHCCNTRVPRHMACTRHGTQTVTLYEHTVYMCVKWGEVIYEFFINMPCNQCVIHV